MKLFITIISCIWCLQNLTAQTHSAKIDSFRKHYIAELLADERAPIKAADTNKLQFYKANKKYAVLAKFEKITDTVGFDILTHSGKRKKHFIYGLLRFQLQAKPYTLHVYQNEKLMTQAGYADYLFIPFNDYTNYKTTFGGGRYIDLREKDIKNDKVLLDFNMAYNPYCAFAEGFNCPIPPAENKLAIKIPVGEKLPIALK
jgi:uncharacterized protein